jgi:hypothetical protein
VPHVTLAWKGVILVISAGQIDDKL